MGRPLRADINKMSEPAQMTAASKPLPKTAKPDPAKILAIFLMLVVALYFGKEDRKSVV